MAVSAPTIIERFEYRGFHGCKCCCKLELLPLAEGRTAVIATEMLENRGTSITNVAEHLASYVCDRFGIDPERLVWIEHYGYDSPFHPREPRDYDLVTFERRAPEKIVWAPAVLRMHPDGWPGYFEEPEWRIMREEDWRKLGLEPRS